MHRLGAQTTPGTSRATSGDSRTSSWTGKPGRRGKNAKGKKDHPGQSGAPGTEQPIVQNADSTALAAENKRLNQLLQRPRFCKAYQRGECINDPATCPNGPHLGQEQPNLVEANKVVQKRIMKENVAAASRETTPTPPKGKAKAKSKQK